MREARVDKKVCESLRDVKGYHFTKEIQSEQESSLKQRFFFLIIQRFGYLKTQNFKFKKLLSKVLKGVFFEENYYCDLEHS
tara:strand:+ start:222 stop:464 length:243 start_codon:yes stop_codon:yes gene_type:complete